MMYSEGLLASFWQRLSQAGQPLLMLDYDGTLAPFVEDPQQAYPYAGVTERLEGLLEQNHTRVVVVSGRPSEDLVPLLGLAAPPEIWGCHGWQQRLPSGYSRWRQLPSRAQDGLAQARQWLEQQGLASYLEIKLVSLAVHWRGQPQQLRQQLETSVRHAWEPLSQGAELEIHAFDGGLELRCPGRHKGSVVSELLTAQHEPAAAAYLGDDATDEDAFHALKGQGLSVLVRSEYRPTVADVWIRPPAELLDFLDLWLDALRRQNG